MIDKEGIAAVNLRFCFENFKMDLDYLNDSFHDFKRALERLLKDEGN